MPRSAPEPAPEPEQQGPSWTFLSNHAHVLICLARDPEMRMRDIAALVGITERAVQRIVRDLLEGGYIEVEKDGRRNSYTVIDRVPLRHRVESHKSVRDLLQSLK